MSSAEPRPEPPWLDEPEPASTVTLLFQQFGDVLIPIEAVRQRYFRNRNAQTFRRALRDGEIPLPVVTLDDSHKTPRYVCLYQLAAYIEHRARRAANDCEDNAPQSQHARLHRAMSDAVPTTDFRMPLGTAD
ncbi:pyocin activator PrtN family protein [Halomonas sp. SL1]|uniref:pyocin activator PrtN family protein n=1 Tax=Halomonas sp. SL1 TaxID=2137478 RepID=UPI000D17BE81|nr:pyocin activator PrtN family protein [Halomonas sp. SL1]RAH37438.1 transcriptional regulator [Halomonas sp. SL1]